ncbi:hypothetical protein V5N11_021292 [Cardamine amara subsp. amara]|uniref:Uncharacterized protein n=1 Tax=Cardamine amara subsp. amara TaxID=228776 RepID=A0ABD1B2Q3_CARAN
MPRNHGEISLNDQNGVNNDTKKTTTTTTRKKKKKKEDKDVIIADDNDLEKTNQLLMPSISKPKKQFLDRIRKKPKSPKRCSGSHKGGCFRVMRHRRTEEDDDDSVSSPVSDPNDERFTHEMFRVMLETNDFCSVECNPHR